jgi:hypothetical protein
VRNWKKSASAMKSAAATLFSVTPTMTSISALIVRPNAPTPQRAIRLLPVRVTR